MKITHIPVAGAAVIALATGGYVSLHNSGGASAAKSTGIPSTAAAAGPIKVDLSEFAVQTSAATANAGKITFSVTNTGKIEHELVILRTAKPAADLGKGSRIEEVVHVGEVAALKSGKTKTLTLALKPGHYSLVCNLPGHYMAGMRADLTIS
jgi:uncharacterized cupredoxin-like copper-binding protein